MVAAVIEEQLTNPKLHAALETYMRLTATHSYFSYCEEIENMVKNLRLYLNPSDSECYTDFSGIYIGLQFDLLDGNLDQDYITVKVIIGHEVAHIRFTSKIAWESFCSTATGKYRKLSGMARDVLNIVEDGRIEYHMGMASNFLKKGFMMLRHRMGKMIQNDFDNFDFESELEANEKLNIIRNAILYIVCRRVLPKIKHDEILDYVKKIYPYVLYSRTKKSTDHAVKVTEKIMEILKPLREQYDNENENRMESKFGNRSKGTHFPMENQDIDDMGRDRKSSKEKDNKELPDKLREQIETVVNQVESSGFGGDVDLKDYVDDIASLIDKYQEQIEEEAERTYEKLKKESQEPVTQDILHDFLNSHEKTGKQRIMESNEAKKIKELKPNLDLNIHKGCVPVFKDSRDMQKFSPSAYGSYIVENQSTIMETAKELQKLSMMKLESYLRMQRRGRLDKRMIVQAAAFQADKVFRKKMIENKQVEMDVMLLVDCSGSNTSQIRNDKNKIVVHRFQMNRLVAIVMHEILMKAKFNHSVWGFEEHSSRQQLFTPMIDFANCFEKDAGLKLMDIGAGGGNRDGYAIAYAGNYLAQNGKSDKKLLLVLSDGQPAGYGYGGVNALQDVKAQVKELAKKGVKTIGIFSGSESENQYFRMMYESPIFVNNDTIFDLPRILKELLLKEFREHLSTF